MKTIKIEKKSKNREKTKKSNQQEHMRVRKKRHLKIIQFHFEKDYM